MYIYACRIRGNAETSTTGRASGIKSGIVQFLRGSWLPKRTGSLRVYGRAKRAPRTIYIEEGNAAVEMFERAGETSFIGRDYFANRANQADRLKILR